MPFTTRWLPTAAQGDAEIKRLVYERDRANRELEDLSALRCEVVLFGTEAEVDAHDARRATVVAFLERAEANLKAALARADAVPIEPMEKDSSGPHGGLRLEHPTL